MKPAAFAYRVPETVEETLNALGEHGEDAKVLAGGQSLVPLLNFRMARPEMLVDVNHLDTLGLLRRRDRTLHIGALSREAQLERSAVVARGWPVLAEAVRYVGHPAIRNRGTVGGSVAHCDPAAELPTALTALDARFRIRSLRGGRTLDADAFFVGYLTNAMDPDELLVEIEVPPMAPGSGSAFTEYARLHGDFALAGAAAVVSIDADLRCRTARLALLGAGGRPVRARSAEAVLVGARIDQAVAADAAELAGRDSDPPAPADHRRALLRVLTERALLTAAARAEEEVTR